MPDVLTLQECREAVLSEADWAPAQSASFLAELDRFIWQAMLRVAARVPGLFASRLRLYTQPVVENASTTDDRLSTVVGEAMVLYRGTTNPDRTPWNLNGFWDSRHIWTRGADGVTHRFQSHEWWLDGELGTSERVSLDRPYPGNTATDLTYMVFTDPYLLASDVMQVLSVRRFDPVTETFLALAPITEQDFEERFTGIPADGTNAVPFYWAPASSHDRLHVRHPPRRTPTVTNAGAWTTDEPGTWRARYTICWGRRDLDARDQLGQYDPVWESPASPPSAVYTTTAGGGGAALIDLPSIDYIANYAGLPASSDRNTRSGYRIRVYVQRVTSAAASPVTENAGYHLLAEVDANAGEYLHDGSRTPVYERPLKTNQHWFGLHIWPHSSQRVELDVRAVLQPRPFYVAEDVLDVPPGAIDLVVLDARRRLATKLQQAPVAAELEALLEKRISEILRSERRTITRVRRGPMVPAGYRGDGASIDPEYYWLPFEVPPPTWR